MVGLALLIVALTVLTLTGALGEHGTVLLFLLVVTGVLRWLTRHEGTD